MPLQAPYKSPNQVPIEGYYTAKDIHATDASRAAVTVTLTEGRVLITDPYAVARGEDPGKSFTVMDKDDTNFANAKYGSVIVVTNASLPKDTAGGVSGKFEGVTGGLVQALIEDASNLAVGALLYITDDTGTLNDTPATALTSVLDTFDELHRVDTRAVAVLEEAHNTGTTTAVLRWVRLLGQPQG